MKVEFEELLHLQKEIDRSTKEMAARLEVVRQKTNAISRLQSFKGKAADSAKHYFHTTHGEMIEALVTAARQVQHRYNQIISEFEGTVDDSPGAVLHADYMHDLNQKTRILKNQMMDIYHEGLQVLHSISDIVSIPAPDLGHFIESAEASQKFVNEVNEKLHAFDRKALQIVEESRRDVDRVMKKVMEAGERSLVGGGPAERLNDNGSSLHEQQAFVDKSAIFILMSNGFKAMQRTYKYINKSNTLLTAAIQFYIYYKLDKGRRKAFKSELFHNFTKEEYRTFNNYMNNTIYKINGKALLNHLAKYKGKALSKENFNHLLESIETFGRERGKLAMKKEFENLYGIDKFREMKKLSPIKKAVKISTTFVDEFAEKKYKAIKKTVRSLPEWKKPKVAYKNLTEEIKESFKGLNTLGKGAKVAGKALGPLGYGLIAADNYKKYKGDTQKVVVGTVIDGAFGTAATAAGTAIGSAFFPPIGTVVGFGVGTTVSYLINHKWGSPSKNIADRSKEVINKGVDSIEKVSKSIGGSVARWFK